MWLQLESMQSVYLSLGDGVAANRLFEPHFCFTQSFRLPWGIIFPFLSSKAHSPFLFCTSLLSVPLLCALFSIHLVVLGSILPLLRRNLPTETIPGLFCKSSAEHEFYMGCTQSSVNAPHDHCGWTLPTQPDTQTQAIAALAQIHTTQRDLKSPWEHKYSLTLTKKTKKKKPLRRILEHAAYSEHRWNASDQRRSDGCLMFYWS